MILLQCSNPEKLEAEVNQVLQDFDIYFRSIQSDGVGLAGAEVAVIKTFCAYMSGLGPNNPRRELLKSLASEKRPDTHAR